MSCGQHPLGSDEGSAAQVLVEGVDEGHLPAPFTGGTVFTSDYPAAPVGALDTAHVLVGDRVLKVRPR